jgi:hypothetical protein
MAQERRESVANPLPFEAWKLAFRQDCAQQGKLTSFNAMGDSVLQLLWRQGLHPSVNAIVADAAQDERKAS